MDQIYAEKMPLIQGDVQGIEHQVQDITVRNDAELKAASELRMMIRKRETRIDTLRLEATASYREQVEIYNAAFKTEADKLKRARRTVEDRIEAYMKVQELKALEEQLQAEQKRKDEEAKAKEDADRLRQEAAATEDVEAAAKLEEQAREVVYEAQLATPPPEQAQATVRTAAGTMSRKKIWAFEITDVQKFVRERPDLCMPDPVKVREWMMGLKQDYEGEGIRVFQKSSFSGR